MRYFFFFLFSLFFGVAASAQRFSEDFSHGIPEGFTLLDGDGQEPSTAMKKLGFAVGTPWVALTDNSNGVAASTSWYATAGTSDDWLITPAITVEDAARLTWRARAYDAKHADGYSVYVLTSLPASLVGGQGGSSATLKSSAWQAFTTAAETNEWSAHAVDLSSYAGQTVYVAFVNDATDCSRLYIDDIVVGSVQSINITPVGATGSATGTALLSPTAGLQTLTARISTELAEGLTGFTAGYRATLSDGTTSEASQHYAVSVTPDSPATITLPEGLSLQRNEACDITFWAQADDATESQRVETTATLRAVVKGVVAEEATGNWCQWCVQAIVAMERMNAAYPDNFMSIAVHSGDAMAPADYSPFHDGVEGYPYIEFMRMGYKHSCDAQDVETMYKRYLQYDAVAAIDGHADYDEATGAISVTGSFEFLADHADADYRIAYTLVENNVHDDAYYQKNAYAGGANGEMGGWENLPSVVPGSQLYFQDVARSCFGTLYGNQGLLPATIKAGETYTVTYDGTFPESVKVPFNCEVVMMLVDSDTRAVLNAMKMPISGTPVPEGIEASQAPLWGDVSESAIYWVSPFIKVADGKKVLTR